MAIAYVTTQAGLSRLRPFVLLACSVTALSCVQVSGVCNEPADGRGVEKACRANTQGLLSSAGFRLCLVVLMTDRTPHFWLYRISLTYTTSHYFYLSFC